MKLYTVTVTSIKTGKAYTIEVNAVTLNKIKAGGYKGVSLKNIEDSYTVSETDYNSIENKHSLS